MKNEKEDHTIPYLTLINDSLDCMYLKNMLPKEDRIDFELTVDGKESGFPTVTNFYLLEKNKEKSGTMLEALGSRESIIDNIRKSILKGYSIKGLQINLIRHNFFSKLNEINPVKEYHLNEPKFAGIDNGKKSYLLEWSCIERGTNLPVLYRMCFDQDKWSENPDENANLKTLIYSTQYPGDLRVFVQRLDDEIEPIHPKLIEKYKIGPFYNSVTENNPEINNLFEGVENPFMLKFEVNKVMSLMSKQYANPFLQMIGLGRQRESFGPLDSEKKLVVPFRIKQKLGNKDEKGNSCKVYGITNSGEVIA